MIVMILIIAICIKINALVTEYQIIISMIVGIITSFFASFIFYVFYLKISTRETLPTRKLPPLNERLKNLADLETRLTPSRKMQILEWRRTYEPRLRQKRREHLQEIREQQEQQKKETKYEFLEEPAWCSVSSAPSEEKYRLTMGFRNLGCAYWRVNPDKIGCLHCGYGSAAIQRGNPTKHQLLKQFEKAVNYAMGRHFNFDVIEFLNDGSFFNYKEEFPESFPLALFKRLGEFTYVKRILIESRPEYITKDKIQGLITQLRDDQKLEIGIGLETPDDFIREACINKGYDTNEFEEDVKLISAFRDCCGIIVYTLVKSAFLTEKEAIEDVVETIKYLSEISKKYKIEIVPKLEPAVIARGTILDILHFDVAPDREERYNLLSYWSVVEIIASAHLLGLSTNIRIGAREDMDIIEKVPAIYNRDGTFNQYDFWVYYAVQQFNSDHDFVRFLANIQVVLERDESFMDWKRQVGIDMPAISKCIESLAIEIDTVRNQDSQKRMEYFLLQVFDVLDMIELIPESHEFARTLKKQKKLDLETQKRRIEEFINDKFRQSISNVYAEVNMFFFERDNRHMLRVYFQLRNFMEKTSYDIWVGIPTIEINS